jgi:hypothetical protein
MTKSTVFAALLCILGCSSKPPPPASTSDDSAARAPSGLQVAPTSTPLAATPAVAVSSPGAPPPPAGFGKGVVGPSGVGAFDTLKPADLQRLKNARVVFGHQSVGNNLIEAAAALGFPFKHVTSDADLATVALGEAPVADNHDPHRKVRSFAELMTDKKLGDRVDLAGFKFCYVDFENNLKVAGLREAYSSRIDALRAAYPKVRFFHVTPPLTTGSSQINKTRLEFGDWLKVTYASRDVVLDLAAIESEKQDGTACMSGGVRALCPEYASDQGHLKADGATRAAKALLYTFARALGST